MLVSAIIAAFREEERIGSTVEALRGALEAAAVPYELIVVDDGSPDATAAAAASAGARVLRGERNVGKGGALLRGLGAASGSVLLLVDADLGETAARATALLPPVLRREVEMTVAAFPPQAGGAGFGLVKRFAAWALARAGAAPLRSPLSGQRALAREAWERIGGLDPGFGVEIGLGLDAARLGLRVVEVEIPLAHRATGRDLAGWLHRGRQLLHVARAIARRWPLRPPAREATTGGKGGAGSV